MEFIRLNDHLVKCIITAEDMRLHDVSMDDFFSRTDSAMDFIHEVIRQAEIEVNYRPDGPLTSLQITPIRNRGLAIFLTDKIQIDMESILKNIKTNTGLDIESSEMMSRYRNMSKEEQADFIKRFADNIRKEAMRNNSQSPSNVEDGNLMERPEALTEEKEKPEESVVDGLPKKADRPSNLERKIFVFDSMANLLRYVKAVEMPGEIGSSLYKDEKQGLFYLLVDRKEVSVQTLAGVYLTAYEYGQFVSESEESASFIREHYQCIIAENAIGKMKYEC